MSWSVRRILAILLKTLLGLVVLIVLVIGGWITRNELTKRPPGSPPPWLEGRGKYNWEGVSNFSRFDNIPVDVWFGKKRDGHYDTTHLRFASDYAAGGLPIWHGESIVIYVVWPNLRSIDEENEIRKKDGLPPSRGQAFRLTFGETAEGDYSFTDRSGTAPVTRCEPVIRDETRRVRYCNENRFHNKPDERRTNYWPLDESIRTPWYGNPPRIDCYVVNKPGERRFDSCFSSFSYNADFLVQIDTQEALAIELLAHFPKLIDFLQTLEVKP